jgi:hypothetical protein
METYLDFIRFTLPKLTDNELEMLESELRKSVKNTTSPDAPDIWVRLKAIADEKTIRDIGLNEIETDGLFRLQKRGVGLSVFNAIDIELMRRGII